MSDAGIRPLWLTLGAGAWMATIANLPLWRELDSLGLLSTPVDWMLAAALAVVMTSALVAILSLLAWRWTLKPATCVLLVLSAPVGYFMWTYHVVINADMVVNALQTDPREAAALWNARMIPVLLVLGVLPGALVWRARLRPQRLPRQAIRNMATAGAALLVAVCTVLAAYQPLASAMRNHKQLRYLMNPLNAVYALGVVAAAPLRRNDGYVEPIGGDAAVATPRQRPPLLVLVVGETARAANFSLNGYGRPTMPRLEQAGVVSFTDATACGTSTAASLPCMFSHLGKDAYESRRHGYENLLDVLQKAGLAVLWLDNQAGCKGVCARVPSESTAAKDESLCKGDECLDAILLAGLDQRLAALPAERRARGVVIVMHQMGSHGPAYYRRSPASMKRFLPECTSNNLQECSRAELVNAYDNSIAYTDFFLASAIDWLKNRQAAFAPALVYVSDHGESLGENNLYLHGLPYALAPDTQKKVPWITWLSPSFAAGAGVDVGCLRARSSAPVTHDNYFHSVLGLMQVSTGLYDPRKDAYAACGASAAEAVHAARRERIGASSLALIP